MQLKEVQKFGIKQTEKALGLLGLEWDHVLHQIEDIFLKYQIHPFNEFPTDGAEDLIGKIIKNNKFSLALIFNEDKTHVTAVPLPEVYERENRVNLCAHPMHANDDFDILTRFANALLEQEMSHPTPGALPQVIIIEQNLGESRNGKELTIGLWNTWGVHNNSTLQLYDKWLREGVREQTTPRAAGKIPENAV